MNSKKIIIGPHNAEQLLFLNREVWNVIPDLRSFRDQWNLSRMSPELRQTGRRAVLDFLDSTNFDHEKALSDHFGADVTIDKAQHRTVTSESFGLDEHPPMDGTWDYAGFGCHRDGEKISITFWR